MFLLPLIRPLIPALRGQDISTYQPFYPKLLEEIEKGKKELQKVKLKHSAKTVKYLDGRRSASGVLLKYLVTDFAWKEAAIRLLNPETGETRIVKIKKVGPKLVNPNKDLCILVEKRPSGLSWNGFNTPFLVVEPTNWAVIVTKFRSRIKNGNYKDTIYSPYSTALHTEELVQEGRECLREKIAESLHKLEHLREKASAKLNVDLKSGLPVDAKVLERLVLIEHADTYDVRQFQEGKLELNPFDRVFVIVALNREEAYGKTSSPARASGLMQFTNRSYRRQGKTYLGTWDTVKTKHKWARLPSFEEGARNHEKSIQAAVLLHNLYLGKLIEKLGAGILKDTNLEHRLAVAYNAGVGWAIDSELAARKNGTNWRIELAKLRKEEKKSMEPLEYIEKLDFLLVNHA